MLSGQKSVWVIGASGYSGAELCRLIAAHPNMHLTAAFSATADNAVALSSLYPQLTGSVNVDLQAWQNEYIEQAAHTDIVFLALPHEVSLKLAPALLATGCCVIDLSGAFRLLDVNKYSIYYEFIHTAPSLLKSRAYALPHQIFNGGDAFQSLAATSLLSMPGCYPTAATLALAPLVDANVLNPAQVPVITAVSGVSGAGRKAQLHTSFCEVSLRPYAVLSHRHQCEIEQNLEQEVIFVPQLGNFKRGIVATIAVTVKSGISPETITQLFQRAYGNDASVRMRTQPPQVDDVAMTPYCDLYWQLSGHKLVIISAIDNLLKGAASQAIEACNLKFGWTRMEGLV